jgi:hypothetical protein
MDVFQLTKMDKIHLSYILQLSMMTLALFIITTTQVKAQQGQDSHGLTPEQVKQFCRSDNPRLNFVNHTESEICGLPESTRQPQHQTLLDHHHNQPHHQDL